MMLTLMQSADSSSTRICGRLCRYGRLFSGILGDKMVHVSACQTQLFESIMDLLFSCKSIYRLGFREFAAEKRHDGGVLVCHLRTRKASPALAERKSPDKRPQTAVEANRGGHAEDSDHPNGYRGRKRQKQAGFDHTTMLSLFTSITHHFTLFQLCLFFFYKKKPLNRHAHFDLQTGNPQHCNAGELGASFH